MKGHLSVPSRELHMEVIVGVNVPAKQFNTVPKIVQTTQDKCEWGDKIAPLITCEYGVWTDSCLNNLPSDRIMQSEPPAIPG